MSQSTDPLASAYAAYEQFESRLSTAMDQLVATNGFAELFTTSATTMMALTRVVNGAIDQAVRQTRLAARGDVTSLARQLARTEDKLERLLQAVEAIQDQLAREEAARRPAGGSVAAPSAPAAAAPAASPTEPPASARRASRATSNGTATAQVRRRRPTGKAQPDAAEPGAPS